MIYTFNDYRLDITKLELRRRNKLVAMEPQVFSLLRFLIEERERVVSKDEIIEKVWRGRIISDASVASRVRLARHAIGDDGKAQRCIRTIRGYGFRFVAEVAVCPEPSPLYTETRAALLAADLPDTTDGGTSETTKPSIAVLPFRVLSPPSNRDVIADAIPHDLIQALSRLRWLLVIARGSSFRFRAPDPDVRDIGRRLDVCYCLVGTVEFCDPTIIVSIELSDTRTGGVVWADQFRAPVKAVHEIRAEAVARVVSSLEFQIPYHEARSARLCISENLDCWSNYHLGLQHMFRFNYEDNSRATALFERAIAQDPNFARAYAGLSFTHFQEAFVKYGTDPPEAARRAHRFALKGVELDPLDPFANFTLGRYYWLEGELENSFEWLDRALRLSPNYAQCIYSHAFTDVLSGNPLAAQKNVADSLRLSPLDPLQYGMHGVRSLSFASQGDFENAAIWGEKAARAPGAHYLIDMIAVIGHSLVDNRKKARFWVNKVRRRKPDANQNQFFESFPFAQAETRKRISEALSRHGL